MIKENMNNLVETERVNKWRLYGKYGNQKRFAPIDWKNGKQVGNLIYASMFTDEEKAILEKVDIPANPDWQFEFRAI